MKQNLNRIVSAVLVLVLFAGLLSGLSIPARAASVDYVYNGKYIYNWGTRGTTATFLSPNAERFYQDNSVTYADLASLTGSSTASGVPQSQLYTTLAKLMMDNHSHITTYDETRYQYLYTDCENSAKTTKAISSFYAGIAVGPAWDAGTTWNREHTWPNSKSSSGSKVTTNRESDIMMLRPTSSSVNSSRGNKAYGESSGYYDPNMESNGALNVHGDVARTILYVYVRWGGDSANADGALNYMWGTSGAIESMDVLLKWMEEDPVDTWELGRNDSVEAITGTRNVFVDYPELAFILFGRAVPADMTTPSGEAANADYNTITATSNNNAWGTVYISGTTIVATPAAGYQVSGYTIISGSASVIQNGNTFRVQASSDCTIRINFTAKPTSCKHTNTTNDAEKKPTCTESGYTAGVYCKDCKNYISGHTTVPATGHSYTDTVTPPTATEDGFTTHSCVNCGHSYTDTVVPALGVSYTVSFSVPEGVTAIEDMLCSKSGITLPTADVPATDKDCRFAGWAVNAIASTTAEPELLMSGAVYSAGADTKLFAVYTYTADGQAFYATAISCGHSRTELSGDYSASCSSPGYSGDTVCADCGKVVTAGEEVAAKGHDLKDVAEKPATTEETGIAGHQKCSVCGKLFDAEGNQLQSGDLILDKLTEEPKPTVSTGVIIAAGVATVILLAGIAFLVMIRRKE